MRLAVRLLPALFLLLACKPDPGDEAGESSTGNESCSAGVIGDPDPNYPPCSCDYTCEDNAECRFTSKSSICEPECTEDSDCPPLGGVTARCSGTRCFVPCNANSPCPSGYICLENINCQA